MTQWRLCVRLYGESLIERETGHAGFGLFHLLTSEQADIPSIVHFTGEIPRQAKQLSVRDFISQRYAFSYFATLSGIRMLQTVFMSQFASCLLSRFPQTNPFDM